MKKLLSQLQILKDNTARHHYSNNAISAASIGWHIEHCLLVQQSVLKALQESDPLFYKSKNSLIKTIVLATGYIPRGKGKAPGRVTPSSTVNEELLLTHLQSVKKEIENFPSLTKRHYFDHPYFGPIKLKKAIKFIAIHTNHHVKIIKDINKSPGINLEHSTEIFS